MSVGISFSITDPSFERSSMTQMQDTTNQTTLVISLSVAVSCVVIVCVIAVACVYVTKVKTRQASKRDGHMTSGKTILLSTDIFVTLISTKRFCV